MTTIEISKLLQVMPMKNKKSMRKKRISKAIPEQEEHKSRRAIFSEISRAHMPKKSSNRWLIEANIKVDKIKFGPVNSIERRKMKWGDLEDSSKMMACPSCHRETKLQLMKRLQMEGREYSSVSSTSKTFLMSRRPGTFRRRAKGNQYPRSRATKHPQKSPSAASSSA